MRIRSQGAALVALALVASSCADPAPLVGPEAVRLAQPAALAVTASAMPPVRISEIHYDNTGTDAGEAIEISGPAGTDLSGWQVVLYNGAGNVPYGGEPVTLAGAIPATCGARGVVVVAYPPNGLQNGAPDGMALLDASGAVVELLSYEGTIVAAGGPAAGVTSVDIGVAENGSEAVGGSLQRQPDGSWQKQVVAGFGSCEDGTTTPPVTVAALSVTPATVGLEQGGSATLTAHAVDAGGVPVTAAHLVWRSSDAAVASVSPTGELRALGPGSAQVTARAANGVTATATVTVVAAMPPVRFSEIHYDNFGDDVGEAIEVEGPAGTDLAGWKIVLYNLTGGAEYDTRELSGLIPNECDGRGTIAVTYPPNGIQNGSRDGFALVDAAGTVVEFLSYEGTLTATDGPAAGLTSTDIGAAESSSTPTNRSLSRNAIGAWSLAFASFGTCNAAFEAPLYDVGFSGRTAADPALPVGFQDQVFASLRDVGGASFPTTFTWQALTPEVATIDADGVVTAVAAGTATFRATAADGTTGTHELPTIVATRSTTAAYADHLAFGTPTDASPADDVVLRYPEYVSSFDLRRGIPNWVSYNLEATHFGSVDRCDCFTFDPQLPAAAPRYTTADYTGAGAYHGYGIDRGHLVRSFDREAGLLDNAVTYYFTNIVPQAADNNQGPWSAMENHLGALAQSGEHEVFIVAGATGSRGTVKDEGKITIPEWVWKVALVLPRDAGLASVQSLADVQVVAAIMPNVPGIRAVDWNTYRTTVDAVEALSGYDLLALLPDALERGVENGGTLVRQLVADGAINAGLGKALQAKLDAAAAALARGNTAAALDGYRAVLAQLDDLVQEGVLTDAEAAPLRTVVTNTITTIGG